MKFVIAIMFSFCSLVANAAIDQYPLLPVDSMSVDIEVDESGGYDVIGITGIRNGETQRIELGCSSVKSGMVIGKMVKDLDGRYTNKATTMSILYHQGNPRYILPTQYNDYIWWDPNFTRWEFSDMINLATQVKDGYVTFQFYHYAYGKTEVKANTWAFPAKEFMSKLSGAMNFSGTINSCDFSSRSPISSIDTVNDQNQPI